MKFIAHVVKNNINMFKAVKYRYFLGLTATFERLDGKKTDYLSLLMFVIV